MAKETIVWIKPLDLPWEQVGAGQFAGITPENVQLEADGWGPSNTSFDLRRDPDAPALDLGAGAEVEVHVGGVNVWDGFVSATPKRRGDFVISVQCRGWQDETDGRIFNANYVHASMADWKDSRSSPAANLGLLTASCQVGATGGAATIQWPSGTVIPVGTAGGIAIDLGPRATAIRIMIDWTRIGPADGNWVLYGRGTDSPDLSNVVGYSDAFIVPLASGGANSQGGSFSTGKRYVHLFVLRASTAGTMTADAGVRITGIRLFRDVGLESGGASALGAYNAVLDALAQGTLALSPDMSEVQPTSFPIPDFWQDPKGLTAREVISKANAYHNWITKLAPGRRFVFRPRSTSPTAKVGEWSALPEDEDASSNDITEIYNHCRATSTAPDGQLVIVDRYAATSGSVLSPFSVMGPFSGSGSFSSQITSIMGQSGGLTYVVTLGVNSGAASSLVITSVVADGVTFPAPGNTSTFAFNPPSTGLVTVNFTYAGTSSTQLFLSASRSVATVVDRHSRVRSKILDATAALPPDGVALAQLADTWLSAHTSTPFKGQQAIQGQASVRDYFSGEEIPPERLLLMTGELLHFDDRVDPDTGAIGRDGRLVNVKYTPLTDTAVTTIDNSRSDFEALLARIGVIAGSG